MKRVLITFWVLLTLWSVSDAQLWKVRRFELMGGVGATQFFSDLGGYSESENVLGLKDFTLKHTRFNLSTGFKYRISSDVSVKLGMAYGLLRSTDERGSNIPRGFESRTSFFEPEITGEYYFIKNKYDNSYSMLKGNSSQSQSFFSTLDLYFFTGFGGVLHNVKPNAKLSSASHTDSGFSPVVPVGIGANMQYSGNVLFSVELGRRFVFGDLVDGYTSSYSKKDDTYYLLNFSVIYRMRSSRKGFPTF